MMFSRKIARSKVPVNCTEAKVGIYELPELLTLSNGEAVSDVETRIEQRHPGIFRQLEENQIGRSPGRPDDMTFEGFDPGTPTFGGKTDDRLQFLIN